MADKKKKVVVGMSGGVDSSVAAALLVEQGYEVIGITIKTYNYEDVGGNIDTDEGCCSLAGINDARQVAEELGIPHRVINLSKEFHNQVIKNFIDEYLKGRTPNPCVICNRAIKWAALISQAEELGAAAIATGHYAKVRHDETLNRFVLSCGEDKTKDQSYALWGLTQDFLGKTIFPLADKTKTEVRSLAKDFNIHCANKGESFEICFVPDNDYGRFLRDNVPDLGKKVDNGDIVYKGKIVGKHHGYPFYTIGQRRGIGISSSEPLYVSNIDPESNTISLGEKNDLFRKGLIASNINLIKYERLQEPKTLMAKIRYKDAGSPALVRQIDNHSLEVIFDAAKRAITPGQSLVLYEGSDVVGGGIIDSIYT